MLCARLRAPGDRLLIGPAAPANALKFALRGLSMLNQLDIQLLTIEELGGILKKSPHSIRHDLTRNPKSLPPLVRIPGCKRNLWRVSDVRTWQDALVQSASPQPISLPAVDGKPRPGRPSKSEALAKARASKKQGGGAK